MWIHESVLVVAHPDDEALWFSSILSACKKVIVCFGPTANEAVNAGRADLIANYPLDKVEFLNVRESPRVFRTGRWSKPVETDAGLQLRRPNRYYMETMKELEHRLMAILDGEKFIVTHNPWGEYGHEEHVQVFRVLEKIRRIHAFCVHVNGYVSNRSIALMLRSAGALGKPTTLPVDIALALKLKREYLHYRCWTWRENHIWPRYETFYELTDSAASSSHTINSVTPPLNYINQNFNRNRITQFLAAKSPSALNSLIKSVGFRT